jgi:hypothetical protein
VAFDSYIPSWWKEAIAIEYLPCRDFKKGSRLAEINFALLSEDQINQAINSHKVVSYGQIIQNVDPATFRNRTLLSLFSPIVRPIVNNDVPAVIPNGIVSKHHFPFLGNPINVFDPIETFNSHIQVLDNGVLYQWEIARFEDVEGRHYGRWVSDFVDLSEFDTTDDEFQELMLLKSKTDSPIEVYAHKAELYIEKLKSFRLKAFTELLNVHETFKQRDTTSRSKVVAYKPPSLSHFETMKIMDGDIYTACFIAPIFYRAAIKHCCKSQEITRNHQDNQPHVLDEIYEERAQSIIMAVACLEAIANEIGGIIHNEIWGTLEKLTLSEKLRFIHLFSSPAAAFDTSRHPFQFVSKMVTARNEMIHFKNDFSKCKVLNGLAVSRMEMTLDGELIEKLPKVLADSIKEIYSVSGLPEPQWLKDQPGWKVGQDA